MRTRDQVERATRRLEPLLLAGTSPEAALARREAGSALPGDVAILRHAAVALLEAQRGDGSWGGVAVTAEALLALAELGDGTGAGAPAVPRDDDGAAAPGTGVAVARALRWLRGRRGGAGRFGEGCDPTRHAHGLCHHFLTGFHAPVSGEDVLRVPDDRLVASARALRAAFVWGEGGARHELQLDGLRRVVGLWARPGGTAPVSSAAAVAALDAVLEAPQTGVNLAAAAGGIACLVRTQRGDGTWRGTEFFVVLDTLLRGVSLGYLVPEVDTTLERAAAWLALSQKDDGGWGPGAGPRRMRTAWRVLRHARAAAAGLAAAP